MDCATRHEKSLIGVNIQFFDYEDQKIHIYAIAVKEINMLHTAENLSLIIKEILEEYEIQPIQILSFTTDNAANMLKAVEKISDINYDKYDSFRDNHDDSELYEDIDFFSDSDFTEENYKKVDSCLSEIKEELVFNNAKYDKKLEIINLKCVSHCLNLAIKDSLKKYEYLHIIESARTLAKKLRLNKYKEFIKPYSLLRIKIDVVTRWSSLFGMLDRLINHREFCNDYGKKYAELILENDIWTQIVLIREILKPVYDLTLILQKATITLPEVFREWINCIGELKELKGTLANDLVYNMEKREDGIFDNDLFLAGIYLDPYLKSYVQGERLKKVQTFILSLGKRLEEMSTFTFGFKTDKSNNSYNHYSENIHVKKLLNFTSPMIKKQRISNNNIFLGLEKYNDIMPPEIYTNAFDYWTAQLKISFDFPTICLFIISSPSSEVSVERTFSSVKYLQNDLRTNLKSNTLENMLLVKLNKTLH